MGLFKKTPAEKAASLDATAKKLYETGKKVAGEPGGKVGDAVANAFLASFRRRVG
jgi:hypothetical protein